MTIPKSMWMDPPPPKVQRNYRAYTEYLASDTWKCPTSPTGAHHWRGNTKVMTCIHCGKVKELVEQIGSFYAPRRPNVVGLKSKGVTPGRKLGKYGYSSRAKRKVV